MPLLDLQFEYFFHYHQNLEFLKSKFGQLMDKNISELLELTDYNLILEKGALVWHGRTDDLEKSPEIIDRFLYL